MLERLPPSWEMTPDRWIEVLTIVLGSVGIAELLRGSHQYDAGDAKGGATHVGAGNATLFSTALTGELIRHGMPQTYSFAELPFLFAALKDLQHQFPVLRRIAGFLEHYGTKTALITNGAIHGSLAAAGRIGSVEDVLLALGFTGLSTSFAMPTEGNAQNIRRIVTVGGTTLLTIGALLQTAPTVGPFVGSMDIKQLAVVPAIWFVLNGIFLGEEARLLLLRTRETIESMVERMLEVAAESSAPASPEQSGDDGLRYLSGFEALMH